jgi:hypothetical protein
MRLFERQMIRFVQTSPTMRRSATRKTDLLMASWFPMKAVRRLQKEVQAEVSSDEELSYTGFNSTEWDEVPW